MIRLRQGNTLLPLFVLGFVLVLWEALVRADSSSLRSVPAPTEVLGALINSRSTLWTEHLPQTLLETVIGLVIAVIIGLAFAALLDFLPLLKQAVYPLLVVSQTVPIFAIAVVLILVLGFDTAPKVAVVILFCFFPIMVSTLDGLNGTDPDLVALLRAMGASRGQIWRKVRLPSALPAFFSGLRIAATYSIGGAIVGEYVTSSKGLGYVMRLQFSQGHVADAFVPVVIIVLLSIGLVELVNLAERVVMPWYFTEARETQWAEPGIY